MFQILLAVALSTARIDTDIQAVLRRYDIPGATVVIAEGDRVVYTHAFGFSDLANGTPARLDTHYEIGSITKQFTAAAILQLQEAGRLNLDAHVAAYAPTAPYADEITLRQLLTQTSGLPEYLDGPDIDVASTKPATFEQLMARIAGKPLQFTPGSRWQYCNTNYIVLGRVIELVSHERYENYIQRHIIDPLGLTKTFTIADEPRIAGMAVGYARVSGRLEPNKAVISQSFGWSAGDLVSTAGDWSDALRAGRVVAPASYSLMTKSQMTARGDSGYGFGLFIDTVDGQPRIGHTGGDPGFTAADEYFPSQDVRVIALTNDGDANGHPEAGEILTSVAFEAIFPDIAAAALQSSPGEDSRVTASVRTFFEQMQSGGENYAMLTPHLAAKLKTNLAALLAEELAPYGAPTDFVFKGRRTAPGERWFDYAIHFGPGVSLKFGVAFDANGEIAGLSLG
jgi:D-alanyl-D-alanine carboxypeptidase